MTINATNITSAALDMIVINDKSYVHSVYEPPFDVYKNEHLVQPSTTVSAPNLVE